MKKIKQFFSKVDSKIEGFMGKAKWLLYGFVGIVIIAELFSL